ncbi:guanylate kinase-associated protein mars [Bactrocera tryoni]|uniref:guanylate kinase-associated protein mars n=1 Tax=Bactrocera tryoni TaxID=59916 RepID=UPI001A96CAC2|nr:guanylate kinase-associated protein mars [Bactrocera tryoni]
MDRYRSLYKENSSMMSPAQHNRTNRELQNANRAKKRREIFESGRNFNVSPTPKKSFEKENQLEHKEFVNENNEICFENKENVDVVEEILTASKCKEAKSTDQTEINKSRIALVATSKKNSEKSTRQEAFLLKFIQWKEAHKLKEQKRLEPKKRPFVPSGGVGGNTFSDGVKSVTAVTSKVRSKEIATFVPKDHKTFKPPIGLKNPVSKMTSAAKRIIENDRKSFYTAVPTPPKNKQDNAIKADVKKPSAVSRTPAISTLTKNATTTPATSALKSIKAATITKSSSTKSVKTPQTTTNAVTKPTAVIAPNKKGLTYPSNVASQASAIQKSTLNTCQKAPMNEQLKSTSGFKANSVDKVTKTFVNRLNNATKFAHPQPVKAHGTLFRKPLAQPLKVGTNAKLPNAGIVGNTGVIGKSHLVQSKRVTAQVNEHRNAKLATNFKAKSTQVSKFNRPTAPSKITIKGKTLLGGKRICTADAAFAIAETPTDLLNINPFEPFVTSTRVKSLSPHSANAPNISPVNSKMVVNNNKEETESNQNIHTHSSTSAKRALLPNAVKPLPQNQIQRQKSKFNFVRYSVGLSELESDSDTGDVENEEKASIPTNQTELTMVDAQPNDSSNKGHTTLMPKTPPPTEPERPVNYISSFVSVSRGKVSARKEREKRDSIYLPNGDDTLLSTTLTKTEEANKPETPCKSSVATPVSVEARRILEAVRYFRLQLQNEIERLHTLCDEWDEYKSQNLPLLQKTGGEDMINVTIGQTKLLTSKKFQQFKGLIDRCESGAKGTAAADDGSEDTKLITDVDLEGFWSMLNLQVDNVEKRFENLKRWKANNWSDPDDVEEIKQDKIKPKPKLNKVKKPKAPVKTAKASSGLQAMLRKMHAEMRKNKETTADPGANIDGAMILTPTRQRKRRSQSGTPKIGSGGENNNSTPRRVSVVVRDRKSLSAAATVISLPADSKVIAAAAAHRRLSRIAAESPKSIKACGNELRRSINSMERALAGSTDLLRSALAGNAYKSRRRSGTPNFIELPLDSNALSKESKVLPKVPTPTQTSPPAVNVGRKSILKTPGTAKGKPKSVIFSEKLRVKKFKFTLEDDEPSEDEEQRMQTSTEEPLDDQRTYSLRTRKVVLRPSSEFEIPKA